MTGGQAAYDAFNCANGFSTSVIRSSIYSLRTLPYSATASDRMVRRVLTRYRQRRRYRRQ